MVFIMMGAMFVRERSPNLVVGTWVGDVFEFVLAPEIIANANFRCMCRGV